MYEELIKELEEIVKALESGNLTLDESIKNINVVLKLPLYVKKNWSTQKN